MPQETPSFLGAGDVLFNPLLPGGALAGFMEMGDASEYKITPKSEQKDDEYRSHAKYGQLAASVALAKPAEFNVTLRRAYKRNLALAFMGTQGPLAQGSGSVTDQAVLLKPGGGAQLAHQNISTTGFVLTSSPAGTTYVLNTDYTVNHRLGLVFPVPESALAVAIGDAVDGGAVGLNLLVDYAYGAIAGTLIAGATILQARGLWVLDGTNLVDGRAVVCRVWEGVLTVSSPFDLMADDYPRVQLSGRLVTPPGRTSPFEVELRN